MIVVIVVVIVVVVIVILFDVFVVERRHRLSKRGVR